MPDWEDPTIYAALLGAATGVTASALSIIQWREKRAEARAKKEAEVKPLTIDLEGWNDVPLQTKRLVEVTVGMINPATRENAVRDVSLRIAFDDLVDQFPVANPEWREGEVQFPTYRKITGLAVGDVFVREDAMSVPFTLSANESKRGRLYFSLPKRFGGRGAFDRRRPTEMTLLVEDMRGQKYEIGVPARS